MYMIIHDHYIRRLFAAKPYGVSSPGHSDILLSTLDSHHVAVDYLSYCIIYIIILCMIVPLLKDGL